MVKGDFTDEESGEHGLLESQPPSPRGLTARKWRRSDADLKPAASLPSSAPGPGLKPTLGPGRLGATATSSWLPCPLASGRAANGGTREDGGERERDVRCLLPPSSHPGCISGSRHPPVKQAAPLPSPPLSQGLPSPVPSSLGW